MQLRLENRREHFLSDAATRNYLIMCHKGMHVQITVWQDDYKDAQFWF